MKLHNRVVSIGEEGFWEADFSLSQNRNRQGQPMLVQQFYRGESEQGRIYFTRESAHQLELLLAAFRRHCNREEQCHKSV